MIFPLVYHIHCLFPQCDRYPKEFTTPGKPYSASAGRYLETAAGAFNQSENVQTWGPITISTVGVPKSIHSFYA